MICHFFKAINPENQPTNNKGEASKPPGKDFSNFLVVAGTANKALAADVCKILGMTPTPCDVSRFSDGELSCIVNDSVRGKDVYLIQSFGHPVHDNLMELLLTITTLRRSGANNITAVIPYFGYKFHRNRGLPIETPYGSRFMWNSAADIAKMLTVCGVDKVISVDLQRAGQNHEAAFFQSNIPVETVDSTDLFVDFFANTVYNPANPNHEHVQNKVVVLSSNTEFVKKAKRFQRKLQKKASIGKVGYAAFLDNDVNVVMPNLVINDDTLLMGNVDGCDVIITDDLVESGAGVSNLCRILTRAGAKRVYIAASHGLYTGNALQLIDLSGIDLIVTTDTIPLRQEHANTSQKIYRLSVAPLLAQVIETEYGMYYKNIGINNGMRVGNMGIAEEMADADDDIIQDDDSDEISEESDAVPS